MKINVIYTDTSNYNVTIDTDGYTDSPREWDNVGTMICSHRNYNLGDEQFSPDDFDGWAGLDNWLRIERKAVIVLPLGLYDHSGITMYVGDTHDRWDGGQVGFIYCTQADIDREWDGDKVKAEAYLRSEVADYDQYLRGDIYSVAVETASGEEVDQLGGLYGTEAVKAFLDECIEGWQRENLTVTGDADWLADYL